MGSDGGAWAMDRASTTSSALPRRHRRDLIARLEGFTRNDGTASRCARSSWLARRAKAGIQEVGDSGHRPQRMVVLDHDEFIRAETTVKGYRR